MKPNQPALDYDKTHRDDFTLRLGESRMSRDEQRRYMQTAVAWIVVFVAAVAAAIWSGADLLSIWMETAP